EDTIPRPVTTTRLMILTFSRTSRCEGGAGPSSSFLVLRQADAQVARLVDGLAIGLQPAVRRAENEAAAHDALEVDAVFEELGMLADRALERHPAGGKPQAAAGFAQPAEEEAGQLPHAVEAEATRHDRVALEVTGEVPVVRLHVVFGADIALVEGAAGFGNIGDAVDHQHRRQRKLCVAGAEKLATAAG